MLPENSRVILPKNESLGSFRKEIKRELEYWRPFGFAIVRTSTSLDEELEQLSELPSYHYEEAWQRQISGLLKREAEPVYGILDPNWYLSRGNFTRFSGLEPTLYLGKQTPFILLSSGGNI